MLALKLLLVPALLAMVTFAARRFGPGVGGALAGMPWVLGPVLSVLLLEQGPAFAAEAARVSLATIPASAACLIAMARASSGGHGVSVAIVAGVLAWATLALPATSGLARVPLPLLAAVVAAVLWVMPLWLPRPSGRLATPVRAMRHELLTRMTAGALLTLAVSALAERSGAGASGALATFPVITVCIGGFTLYGQGSDVFVRLAHGMARGYWALMAFPLTLALVAADLQVVGTLVTCALASAAAQALAVRRRAVLA
jgi:hypothetical protein